MIRTLVDRKNSIIISVVDKDNGKMISGVPVKIKGKNKENTFYSESDGFIRYNYSSLSSVSDLRLQFSLDHNELFKGLNKIGHSLDLNLK